MIPFFQSELLDELPHNARDVLGLDAVVCLVALVDDLVIVGFLARTGLGT